MAIVVQEERSYQVNWIGILLWIAVIGMLGSVAYYLFFKNPEIVGNILPGAAAPESEFSGMNLDITQLQKSERFQSLKEFPAPISNASSGRSNPFLPF